MTAFMSPRTPWPLLANFWRRDRRRPGWDCRSQPLDQLPADERADVRMIEDLVEQSRPDPSAGLTAGRTTPSRLLGAGFVIARRPASSD